MKNVILKIAFKGTAYSGWQLQQNAPTVQGELKKAVYKITGENVNIAGCSRTDAEVHANDYICNFKIESSIPGENLIKALNSLLPDDIAVKDCFLAAENFNSRRDTYKKEYLYKIYTAPVRDPFLTGLAWHCTFPLDLEKMRRAVQSFPGKKDFAGFMAAGSEVKTTIRTIFESEVRCADNTIEFRVCGNGFLYNMVRIMAGTMFYAGIGKIDSAMLTEIIEKKQRNLLGPTLPGHGLYLNKVFYNLESGVGNSE